MEKSEKEIGHENTLEVRHLCAGFFTQKGEVKAVQDVSLTVPAGKIVGIVGESGCGKSMTARAIMGLLRYPGRVTGGEIRLGGRDILHLSRKEIIFPMPTTGWGKLSGSPSMRSSTKPASVYSKIVIEIIQPLSGHCLTGPGFGHTAFIGGKTNAG